ncbi:4-oxalomesaconate tautomerase, partial [Amaricoccus sp. HAR-UPW-R2A-40]
VSVAMAATLRDSLVGAALPGFRLPAHMTLEHPTGRMDVRVSVPEGAVDPAVYVMRTCRRLFEGAVLARRRN